MCHIDRQSKLLLKTQDEREPERDTDWEGRRSAATSRRGQWPRIRLLWLPTQPWLPAYVHFFQSSHLSWCIPVYLTETAAENGKQGAAVDLSARQLSETGAAAQREAAARWTTQRSSSDTRGTLCVVSCDTELLTDTWLCSLVQGPLATALTSDTLSMPQLHC